jgi:xanthine dehydrogenase small subunit
LESIRNETPLKIVTNGQQFYSPRNIAQLASLVEAFPTATILAGGTDVGLWVTKQHQSLDTIIYIGNVSGLDDIATTDTHLEIGAACTLTDAMTPLLELYPELSELLMRFASPPIRNAGTLGGNIANGSPIGDSMPALLVLQADLVLRNGEVTRTLPLGEFYLDYQKTALRQGEFVERVLIPTPVDGVLVRSYKISKRFDQDISAVCAAFSLHVQKGVVTDFRAAYGGMAAIPARASHCEQALLGKNWNRISLAEAKAALDDDFEPLSDMRSSADYRSEVSKNLLERLFLESENNDEISVYHYGR